ncbi:MAG: hypothetical protein ACRBN8_10395 [Nannocystales bacterium]
MERFQANRLGVCLAAACLLAVPSCKNSGERGASEAAAWVDSPTSGAKSGTMLKFNQLGVEFEVPDTLYVFRNCGESAHTKDDATNWIPIVSCSSGASGDFEFGDAEEEEDPFAEEEYEDASGAEEIDITFFVTKKTRPIDERSVTWFKNKYKQAGLSVDEIAYQSDYQKKAGIYTRLHVMDTSTNTPTREIIQFMFPRKDVVFIARMEYPFGDSRSMDKDWQYILWNFNWLGEGSGADEAPADGTEDEA